ncbi:hypothetical protein [Aurantiacibacter gilvus]|uniref:Uncharacterized protein n=1 Tax=Aurantiacibacter gilvus TaxID=3139141 RepID=A0ABU9I9F4_9SPHN
MVSRTNPHVLRVVGMMVLAAALATFGELAGIWLISLAGGGLFVIAMLYGWIAVGLGAIIRAAKWCWNGGGRHDG